MADAKKGLLIRLTAAQHAEITTRAKAAGMSINQFAIKMMLGEQPTSQPSPPAVLAQAEAALVAALQALRGAQAEAPTQDAPEPEEATEADVAPVAPVEAPVAPASTTVKILLPSDTEARTLLDSRPGAAPLRSSYVETDWNRPLVVIPSRVDETQRGMFQYVGERAKIAAQKRLPIGTPVLVHSDVSVAFYKTQWNNASVSIGKSILVGKVAEGGVVWERIFNASSEAIDARDWVKAALGSPQNSSKLSVLEVDIDSILEEVQAQ